MKLWLLLLEHRDLFNSCNQFSRVVTPVPKVKKKLGTVLRPEGAKCGTQSGDPLLSFTISLHINQEVITVASNHFFRSYHVQESAFFFQKYLEVIEKLHIFAAGKVN